MILRWRGRGSDLGGFFRLRRLTDSDAGVIFGLGNDKAIGTRRRQGYAGDHMGRRQRRAGGKLLIAREGKHVLLPGLIVLRRFILRIDVVRRDPRRGERLRLDRRHGDRCELGRHRRDLLDGGETASGSAPNVGAKGSLWAKEARAAFNEKVGSINGL